MESSRLRVDSFGASNSAQGDDWTSRVTVRIQSGSDAAFREFFEHYCDRLFRLFLSLTRGNEDLSRELLQRVFLKCARGMPLFQAEKKLWAWLSAVGRNCLIDHLRHDQARPFETELQIQDLERAAENDASSELISALEESLRELEPSDQKLIEAIYFEDQSQKKVAEESGVTSKAVESKLARLRRKLRSAILNKLQTYAFF